MDVVYELWEGRWEDDAVLRATARGIYADPDKVHPINHTGKHFTVAGLHLSEPSPQRTPLLFQAGSSTRGRRFAAIHAECVFIVESRPRRVAWARTSEITLAATRLGRRSDDIRFFQGISPVVGGTEAEAKAKKAEYLEEFSTEGAFAHLSGTVGVDLAAIDLDQPLGTIKTDAMRGFVKSLIESAPDKTQTFRDLTRTRLAGQFLTGTPEQIADALQEWQEAGVDGFNLTYSVTPGTFVDFIDGVVPVLQARDLMQKEYSPESLRQKIFGFPRLPERHPAAAYRRS